MPIIRNKKSIDISPIKARVQPVILEQIEEYCQWAGIYDLGYFIEKAATDLLANDVEWHSYKQSVNSPESID